jgi:transposase-like protein
MIKYSTERKESVLKKLSPPFNLSYSALSREEGIPLTTIYTWQKQRGERAINMSRKDKPSITWTSEERFSAIVETAKFNEIELGEYCRIKGIYPEQLKEWKAGFIENESNKNTFNKKGQIESKADKKRITALEKELRRKEKALAEAAALLILRKKLAAFYGEGSEED